MLNMLLVVLIGYLLGSISTGVLLSKAFAKTDIRTQGSGNAGTTNMLRVLGRKAALFTFIGKLFTPASSAVSYEMYAIAAVVLGGVNMAGGRGKILGVFFGALSYATINIIINNIHGLSTDMQNAFQGMVLIVVILIQTVGPVLKEKFRSLRKRMVKTENKEEKV